MGRGLKHARHDKQRKLSPGVRLTRETDERLHSPSYTAVFPHVLPSVAPAQLMNIPRTKAVTAYFLPTSNAATG